jgi:hypothetical protein
MVPLTFEPFYVKRGDDGVHGFFGICYDAEVLAGQGVAEIRVRVRGRN